MKIAVAGGTGAVGALVVDEARTRGHEAVVLARSAGIDLTTGRSLDQALDGVDAVIDTTSIQTQSAEASTAFFTTVTRMLQQAEQRAGVGHHLVLSIVGADLAPHDYYAGKRAQELLVAEGAVPWTLLRATQFHEFAPQMLKRLGVGPVALAPRMRTQPIAAREVAEHLVTLAEAGPAGEVAPLAGPREENLARMMRAHERAAGRRRAVLEMALPGPFGRALRDGTLLPGRDALLGRQSYDDWLASR